MKRTVLDGNGQLHQRNRIDEQKECFSSNLFAPSLCKKKAIVKEQNDIDTNETKDLLSR